MNLTALLESAPTTNDRIGQPDAYGKKRRNIESSWIVGDVRDGVEDGTLVLTLTSHHFKDRKQYSSTLRVSFKTKHDGYSVTHTVMAFGAQGESVLITCESTPRFSAKDLRAHHDYAIAEVQDRAAECAGMIRGGIERYSPVPA